MKREILTLIKDFIIIGVLFVLGHALGATSYSNPATQNLFGLAMAGIPFGWRWASKIITAVSFKGIGIKFLISIFLGIFAIFAVVAGDIIRCISAIAKKN